MLKIKNNQLVNYINILTSIELKPKASRVRTTLITLLRAKVDELSVNELELLNRYGQKDDNGELCQIDDGYLLVPDLAQEFHLEREELLEEVCIINTDEIKERLSFLISAIEDCDTTVAGKEAIILDKLLNILESEGTDE